MKKVEKMEPLYTIGGNTKGTGFQWKTLTFIQLIHFI